jgi:hypothetical protein
VRDVFACAVERRLPVAAAARELEQGHVERALPAVGVEARGRGQHAVEIEQDGVVRVSGGGVHAGEPS